MSEEQLPWRDELDTLLGRLVDEDLSETETARLNEILRTQPEAKAQYHAYLDVHEDLETQFAVPDFGALDAVTKIVEPPQPSYTRPLLAMAALVVIGFFINAFVQPPAAPVTAAPERAEVRPIATIKGLSGSLVYTGDRGAVQNQLAVGDQLTGGTIEGMAPDAWFELQFTDGSTVMISGFSMLTFSDDGQKKLRLKEGGFTANVMPQPKDKPMLVQTRTALFEVLGTRFSVDAELAAATLTVTEGSVRATKLSDNSSVDVPAQHRVTAAINRELVTEKVPDSVGSWRSRVELGRKQNQGEWFPAGAGQSARLGSVPYTIPDGRTIYTLAMKPSTGDHPPVVLQSGSQIRVRGRLETQHRVYFGVTLRHINGDFAGRFQVILPEEMFADRQPFDVTLNFDEYTLDPSLERWKDHLPISPVGLVVDAVWAHTLWDPCGLQVVSKEIITPAE